MNLRHLITSGKLEVHEPNSSSPLVITSSRREWNVVSPLVNSCTNSSARVHDFNGMQHKCLEIGINSSLTLSMGLDLFTNKLYNLTAITKEDYL